jgi:hypothetical protein
LFALALSAFAHVGLVRLNPNLLFGQGSIPSGPRHRDRADLQVRATEPEWMRQEFPKLLDRFESMTDPLERTESPIDLPEPEPFFQAVPAGELPEAQHQYEPLELTDEQPELREQDSEWQPRQEVMAITDQRVREALDVLPRTFRETRFDRPGAPDISLPGEPPDVAAFQVPDVDLPAAFSGGNRVNGFFGFPELGSPTGDRTAGAAPPLSPPELSPADFETPDQVTELDAVENLLQLQTRVFEDPLEPGVRYFKIQLMRNGIESLPVMPRDVVYLLDCSSSMTQHILDQSIEGIRQSLDTLSEQDRVNVVAFRDEVDVLSPQGISATIFGKSQARTFLFGLRSRGRTDVFASLNALQDLPRESGRPMQALLITDGIPTRGELDSSDIIETISRTNQREISMFGVGVGGQVNRLLLDFLSFRNRGISYVAPQVEGIPGAIVQLATEIRRPVLMDLEPSFTGDTEVYPKGISHLYLDRPLILVGKVSSDSGPIAFQIIGKSVRGNHDMVFTLDLDQAVRGDTSLRQEWAWQALLKALSDGIGSDDPTVQAELNRLMQTYNLSVPDAYR